MQTNQAAMIDERQARTIEDIEFTSPSSAGVMCTAFNENGWTFQKQRLKEIKNDKIYNYSINLFSINCNEQRRKEINKANNFC